MNCILIMRSFKLSYLCARSLATHASLFGMAMHAKWEKSVNKNWEIGLRCAQAIAMDFSRSYYEFRRGCSFWLRASLQRFEKTTTRVYRNYLYHKCHNDQLFFKWLKLKKKTRSKFIRKSALINCRFIWKSAKKCDIKIVIDLRSVCK